jgi:hypothetical protein
LFNERQNKTRFSNRLSLVRIKFIMIHYIKIKIEAVHSYQKVFQFIFMPLEDSEIQMPVEDRFPAIVEQSRLVFK